MSVAIMQTTADPPPREALQAAFKALPGLVDDDEIQWLLWRHYSARDTG